MGIGYLPFYHQAEGLVGAFDEADRLLSEATQGNFIDVDKLVPHLETYTCCLTALLYLQHKHTTQNISAKNGILKTSLLQSPFCELQVPCKSHQSEVRSNKVIRLGASHSPLISNSNSKCILSSSVFEKVL